SYLCSSLLLFFFFQAEDGIRDWSVTGVQTCALPIFARFLRDAHRAGEHALRTDVDLLQIHALGRDQVLADLVRVLHAARLEHVRSEERRVGKECRSRGWPDE